MAKPTFAKLKLSSEIAPKELEWGEQKIEIKQYLPIEDKLAFIGDVLNAAADDNRFYSQGKVDMFFAINIIEKYTNLSITDKQKENPAKLYDEIKISGFCDKVIDLIPKDEIEYLYNLVCTTEEQVYKYENSAYGILDSVNKDYNNLNFDVEKLTKDLGNRENAQFLDQVLSKLG